MQTKSKKIKKNTGDNAKSEKALHSITFYIPNKKIEFFTEALKEVSKRLYKGEGKRTVSRYIRELIYEDLQRRNLLDANKNPNISALDNLKKGEPANAKILQVSDTET